MWKKINLSWDYLLLGEVLKKEGTIKSYVNIQKQILKQLGWDFEHVKNLRESEVNPIC